MNSTRPLPDPDTATPDHNTATPDPGPATSGPTRAEVDAQLARRRAKYLTDLLWHIGAFAIINAGFWALDLFIRQDGVQWAHWITFFWGIGLAFHVLAWLIDGRQVERRRAERYVEKARHHTH